MIAKIFIKKLLMLKLQYHPVFDIFSLSVYDQKFKIFFTIRYPVVSTTVLKNDK